MIYSVLCFSEFGQNHNPIWHLNCISSFADKNEFDFDSFFANSSHWLVPSENVDEILFQKLRNLNPVEKQKIRLQFSLQQISEVRKFLSLGITPQIWLDRNPNQAQIQELISLKDQTEIVLIPFERFDLTKTTELLVQNGLTKLTLLFVPKQSLFDGLPTVTSLFQLFIHLRTELTKLKLSTITLMTALPENSPSLKILCFMPSAEHYEFYLKEQNRFGYYLHRTADAANRLSAHLITDIIVSFVQSRRNPNVILMRAEGSWKRYSVKTYWFFYDLFKNVIFHSFVNGILLYPFYKFYWFAKFQYEKRIMKKKPNEV